MYGCPRKQTTADVYTAIDLLAHYKNGFLPETGGVLDQDAKTMSAISFVARAMEEAEEDNRLQRAKQTPPPR